MNHQTKTMKCDFSDVPIFVTIVTLSPWEPEELEQNKVKIETAIDHYFERQNLFKHNHDFSVVTINKLEFDLVLDQAAAIRFLYKIHIQENGNQNGVSQDAVFKAVYGKKRISKNWNIQGNLFKNRPEKKNYDPLLIRVAESQWRLNL